MPARGERARFRLPVTHHTADQQIRIVEGGPVGESDGVAQLTSFVNRSGRLRSDVAGDSPRKGELSEEPLHSRSILGNVRIKLAVSALQVCVRDQGGPAVAGASDEDNVQVQFLDESIEMHVDEVETGRRSPVTQKSRLHVLGAEWLAEQRVVVEINLPHRKIVGRPPISVHFAQFFTREWIGRNFQFTQSDIRGIHLNSLPVWIDD